MAKHAAVACAPFDLDEAVVSPPVAPAVLHQPVVQARFIAVTDNSDGVVVLVTEIQQILVEIFPNKVLPHTCAIISYVIL